MEPGMTRSHTISESDPQYPMRGYYSPHFAARVRINDGVIQKWSRVHLVDSSPSTCDDELCLNQAHSHWSVL